MDRKEHAEKFPFETLDYNGARRVAFSDAHQLCIDMYVSDDGGLGIYSDCRAPFASVVLTRDCADKLATVLWHFADTGELPAPPMEEMCVEVSGDNWTSNTNRTSRTFKVSAGTTRKDVLDIIEKALGGEK